MDAPLGAFTAITAGVFHSCGLRTDGTAECWNWTTSLPEGVSWVSQSPAVAQSQWFPDVPPEHFAFEAVEWAAEVGVTTGYTDGTFKPERPLTKADAALFLERYYDEVLRANESEDFTRGQMMLLLKAINDGDIGIGSTGESDTDAASVEPEDAEFDPTP